MKDKPITCLKFVRPTPKNMCSRAAYLSYVDYGQIDGRGLLLSPHSSPSHRPRRRGPLARSAAEADPSLVPPSVPSSVC